MGLTGLRPGSGKVSRRTVKFEKAKQFYERVKNTVAVKNTAASLATKKTISKTKRSRSRHKKLKAYDFSSLTDVLPRVDAPMPRPDAVKLRLKRESRMKLVEREGIQLKAVLSHPAFQMDPISAIHQHLECTQPPAINQVKWRKVKKLTRKKQGPSSVSQSMEI